MSCRVEVKFQISLRSIEGANEFALKTLLNVLLNNRGNRKNFRSLCCYGSFDLG